MTLGLSHVHSLKTWPGGLGFYPMSPLVPGDRSGRGHRNRRNRLDVRAPLNLAPGNPLLCEHDLDPPLSWHCDLVPPNCSPSQRYWALNSYGHILVLLPDMPSFLLGTLYPVFRTQFRCFPSCGFHNSPSLTSPRAPNTWSCCEGLMPARGSAPTKQAHSLLVSG